MDVLIGSTKTCQHRPILERELSRWGVKYRVQYFEDHPELIDTFGIEKSPLVILDGEVAFVGMPELPELKRRLGGEGADRD